eukprot:GDKI01044270.1.p1 GENE.GDKI01044270.1~~GDKI01044270.1.p1  ORF type:complete len:235 (+),score=46.16 GDKI01044270.1:255-959(+)
MDGIRLWKTSELSPNGSQTAATQAAVENLQETLEGLADTLFGAHTPRRWDYKAYFPFTEPSIELEVHFNEKWVEVLGCGAIHRQILDNCGLSDHTGWAFGLGLERLAMCLFQIPDVRLFWTDDQRFHKQFQDGQVRSFVPYSKHPSVYKDISFWLPSRDFALTDFFQVCREMGGDCVETVEVIDCFEDKKRDRKSVCFRVTYCALDRNLTNKEVNSMQENIIKYACDELKLQVR